MIPEELMNALRARRVLLFAGAGVSMNLGLPSWGALINELAGHLHFEPDVFAKYGNYLELAEYYRICKGDLADFQSWMDRAWHHPDIDISKSEIHRLIVKLDFSLIYTTNYDSWLENACAHWGHKRTVIAGVRDLANAIDPALPQIVKFHGDFGAPGSLVLTEESYFQRIVLDSPIDIKFRNDALGRSVLFIGYSLSDINIRYLLYKIWRVWEETAYAGLRPPSYIFLSAPNPVQEAIFRHRGIIPIVSPHPDPGVGLKCFLQELHDSI